MPSCGSPSWVDPRPSCPGSCVFLAPTTSGAVAGSLIWALLPPAMYVGVVLPDIVDVRALVVRVVVYAVAGITYLSALVLDELVPRDPQGPPTGHRTPRHRRGASRRLALHPLQVVLRGAFDQLLFGSRPDPLTAATHLADRPWTDPVQALDAVRAELVPALRVLGGGRRG